jgi:hypothetical protein
MFFFAVSAGFGLWGKVARMPVPKFIRELVFVTGSPGSRMTV